MSRLTRDGTAEPVSQDQILRRERGQGDINFPCSADHEQDWQPYPDVHTLARCDDLAYIHTVAFFGTELRVNRLVQESDTKATNNNQPSKVANLARG